MPIAASAIIGIAGELVKGFTTTHSEERKRPDTPITVLQRLGLRADFVHVLADGRIVKSGGKELAEELEQKGYEWIEEEVAAAR